jgi:hypothetical protein
VRLLKQPVRSVERLQAMSLAMWTATVAEDPWIARATDRGVRLLNHAADRLDRIVAARERQAQMPSAAVVVGGSVTARVIARLTEWPEDSPLRAVAIAAADLLRSETCDLAAVDAMLLDAARQVCDVDSVEAEARAALDSMRSRVSAEMFEPLLLRKVDELLRVRARLPNVLAIADSRDLSSEAVG